jgi:MFS family permease
VGYFAVGVLIGVTAGLGNALVAVNLNFAQGTLGLYSNEAAWLTAAYLMTNTTANLLLVKFRQQFGLQSFVRYMLGAYALATLLHLFVHGFWSSVLVRAASGMAAAALTSLTILYLMQAMPAPKRLVGVMLGIPFRSWRRRWRACFRRACWNGATGTCCTGSSWGWRWPCWRRS